MHFAICLTFGTCIRHIIRQARLSQKYLRKLDYKYLDKIRSWLADLIFISYITYPMDSHIYSFVDSMQVASLFNL